MNKIYMILAIIFSVFLGETTHCTCRVLPENTNIDENNADDMALVSAFGNRDKAALWKELGVLFRNGKVRTFTSTDCEKYLRTNLELLTEPSQEHSVIRAEALMYFLFPRATERGMCIDEINKILDISTERMELVERHWGTLLLWAEQPNSQIYVQTRVRRLPRSIFGYRISVPEDGDL